MDAAPLTIVGIGSPFGDDQAGWAVIDRLAAWEPPLQAELVQSKAPAVDLLQTLADAQRVMLVDAVDTDLPVGSVHRWSGEAITRVSSAVSTHGFDVGQILALGSRLGLIADDVVLYGIAVDPGACRATRSDISAQVAEAVDVAAARIVAESQALSTGSRQSAQHDGNSAGHETPRQTHSNGSGD